MDDVPLLGGTASMRVAGTDGWPALTWLWQRFKYDLASATDAWPYPDGRYQTSPIGDGPSPDLVAYLVWRPHPKTGADAPVAFALVDGLETERRSIHAFWVVPQLRRLGLGHEFALAILARHPSPWLIGFQHENVPAGSFWRRVATEAFAAEGWNEQREPIPGRPDVPPDHYITVD